MRFLLVAEYDRYLRMRRARYSRRADAFGAAQAEMLRKLANRGVHVSTRKKPVEERLSGYDQNYLTHYWKTR